MSYTLGQKVYVLRRVPPHTIHAAVIDAALIAEYGRRTLQTTPPTPGAGQQQPQENQ